METIKVYLAGGMSSNWQSKVINSFDSKFIFFNPQKHNLDISSEYTTWDLFFVRRCDIVFACMEENNPSGIGLSLEVGFAKALGLTIILVDERSNHDAEFKNKFKIVRESATIVYDNIEDGITYLNSYLRI
jgi:nucleoside 2-deoxyribosyltransferase